ncbi:MAG TPA: restriction endonuclease subunit S [Candidatus Saccharimonadales bacterium]
MKTVLLDEIATVSAGQGAPQGDDSYSNEGTPFIKAGNLDDLIKTNDEYISCRFVGDEIAQKLKLKKWPSNTIVFAKSGMSAKKGRIYCLNNESYIVNHLAIISPNPALINPSFLKYYLYANPPTSLIKDDAYPSISLKDIKNIKLTLPSLEQQQNIIETLDQADSLRKKRKESISKLDDYLKSVFLEMFGDPVHNPRQWVKTPLANFGQMITGNTPPRINDENYSPKHIEWVKTNNIKNGELYITEATEFLSEKGLNSARYVMPGALLVACIAGSANSIGRVAMTDRKVSFNQQINAIQPGSNVSPMFLYWLMKLSRKYILSHATSGMKKILTKGAMQKITMIAPPVELQNEFSEIATKAENIKQEMLTQAHELDIQYQSLLQNAFNCS